MLDSAAARRMVAVREARRAFRRFHARCFWSCRRDIVIGVADVSWVAEQLMKHGDREAWQIGRRLCYFSIARQRFVVPGSDDPPGDVVVHYGRPGGVLPQPASRSIAP